MIEPALLEAILFFAFCLATIIVYKVRWEYVPVVGIAWLIAGMIMTLMPNYGWSQVWAFLNVLVPIVVLLSIRVYDF